MYKIGLILLTINLMACAKTEAPALPAPPSAPDQVTCTQDAMQCPDGSWVGRSGPKCEFICPQTSPK